MSLFDDESVFLLATFTFAVASEFSREADGDYLVDDRGNRQAIAEQTEVKFKLSPLGASTSSNDPRRPTTYTERYSALVVSSSEGVSLPTGIFPGDSGQGEIRGRACTCTIESLQQSGVAPAVADVLGDKVTLSVQYQQGSANAVDF